MEKIFDIVLVSLYWIVGCILIITAGASLAALYCAASRSIVSDRRSITKAFWSSFSLNFKESIKIWLFVAAAIFVFLLNIGILDEKMANVAGIGFMVFYTFCLIFILAVACYAFPALSRFDEPAGWIVKLSLYLTVRHLPVTILLLLLLAGVYLGILFVPYLVVILPGLGAYISVFLIEPILERHSPEQK